MVLWDTSLSPSWSVGFQNKVAIPCPYNSSLDLVAFQVASCMSLRSITKTVFKVIRS